MEKVIWKSVVKKGPIEAVEYLHMHTKLSKASIKRAMTNGSFWCKKGGKGKQKRFRKAKNLLNAGDWVEFYFDPDIQALKPIEAFDLYDQPSWGLWYKPAGALSQGNQYGDHTSVLRQVQLEKGNAFLVHRLDREASGLILFAYNKQGASLLSQMWGDGRVRKFYQIEVLGEVQEKKGEISTPLDGKESLTKYHVHSVVDGNSLIWVEIKTGRFHQIRRHFDSIGHPVIGDPKYGKANKNASGMKLVASKVMFRDPFTRQSVTFELPEDYLLF